MKVGVIGGGLMGLALADRLAQVGHELEIFEQGQQLGGLATWQEYDRFTWDKFYHVILPTDEHLVGLIETIGLGEQLRWQKTGTGYFVDQKMHSVSSTQDFLKFEPLSLWSKFRLGLTILYGAMLNDWQSLEKMTVEDWLIRYSGKKTYEKFWRPLLLAKLGESYRRVSAVFIWTYIKRLYSARSSAAKAEHMGYVQGGYKTIFNRLENRLLERNAKIHLGVGVEQITASPQGMTIQSGGEQLPFDKVVYTGPAGLVSKLAGPDLVEQSVAGDAVEYLGVVCVVVSSREPMTSHYTVNIADEKVPFTGLIGMSNVVDLEETNGLHLTYLPKYVQSTDAYLDRPDEEIKEEFLDGVRHMLPDYPMEAIEEVRVHRARKVQPLQVLNYSSIAPKVATRSDDFYIVNTAQFVNSTLNNNEVAGLVNRFLDDHAGDFQATESASGKAGNETDQDVCDVREAS